jgi:glycosyltransferase involved in cell wall biosynthesis
MTIGYDAKRIYHNSSGLGSYGRNLIKSLVQSEVDIQLKLYNPWSGSINFEAGPKVEEVQPALKNKLFAQIWRRQLISKQAKKDGVQLYHGLSAELPLGLKKNGIPSIVSIHDLIFLRRPDLYKSIDRKIYIKKTRGACKRADLIVAISDQTRNDLIDFLKIDPAKIIVIGQSCGPEFWEDQRTKGLELLEKERIPKRFGLFVGTLEPRKNPVELAQACLKLKVPLILVGRPKPYWTSFYDGLSAEEKLLIRPLKVADNSTLAGLYQQATFMAYPSNFEGFGIPLVEAMACETALITAKNSALQEVAGPGSILVEEITSDTLSSAILRFWGNENLRKESILQNRNFVHKFKPQTIAQQWLETYQELLGNA